MERTPYENWNNRLKIKAVLSATRANKFLRGNQMEEITIKGKIEFCEEEYKQYNREFTATLSKSAAFAYGNGTSVFIEFGTMSNGKAPYPINLDTRYDKTIKRNETDFKIWVQNYFKSSLQKHILTIY